MFLFNWTDELLLLYTADILYKKNSITSIQQILLLIDNAMYIC